MMKQIVMAGALATAVVVAACGGSGTSSSESGAAANTTSGMTAAQQEPAATGAAQTQATAATSAPAEAQVATKLNLNTATRDQFLTVPNVGDRMVREFMEYRPYRSIQQFRREIGKYVSQDQVAAYEQYVYVPVDPNQADAETLRQLPGVDAAVASQLAAARPYASVEAFLAALGQRVSAGQAAAARSYLATS
jgi:DNA uptake protein ComE-like DNA-binding protein